MFKGCWGQASKPQADGEGSASWTGRSHREGRFGAGGGRVGLGRTLTELERWATALTCSSSSKMRSSSSSVR